MLNYQEIVEAIEVLSIEDQDELFELLHKRRVEMRRREIAGNAETVFKAMDEGKVIKGSSTDIKAYLLGDEEE